MNVPKTYLHKPQRVEAMRISPLTFDTADVATKWCPNAYIRATDNHLVVSTPAGEVSVENGDYIVREWDGKFNVMSSMEFHHRFAEEK